MDEQSIKTSQRISRSCTECGRRKIKCDKKSPCQPCIRRNVAHECKRPITRVRGQLTVYAASNDRNADIQDNLDELVRERSALQAQIAELETALALSKPCAHSHVSRADDLAGISTSLKDIVPAFEQFDLSIEHDNASSENPEKDIADRLYEPVADPIFLLLPNRDTSTKLSQFSLQTLGWLHCAVNADEFLQEHERFWERVQLGQSLEQTERPWLSLYLALLAVGILYMDLQSIVAMDDIPQFGAPLIEPAQIAVHTSRLWYEAALKEIERVSCSGATSLPIVQSLSVLTLCHSNFGEHQREWLLTGFAINIARSLDMHKLGSEAATPKDKPHRAEWLTVSRRELGRRLWWSCVIRDWLGSWSRPPSIAPSSFCCQFSPHFTANDDIFPSFEAPASPASIDTTDTTTPSPVLYHSVMSKISYIFYIYIKVNTHQTPSKFAKAIEALQAVRKGLPLHLSTNFPANHEDEQWEREHPWVPFQRYLITLIFNFMQLSIARVLSTKELGDATERYRTLATGSAITILQNYATSVPRSYRLVWIASASVVAAAVYISLDMLANPSSYQTKGRATLIQLLKSSSVELEKHKVVSVHAARGSCVIEYLVSTLEQDHTTLPQQPLSVHDVLRQLSSTYRNLDFNSDPAGWHGDMMGLLQEFHEDNVFLTNHDYLNASLVTDTWEDFIPSL